MAAWARPARSRVFFVVTSERDTAMITVDYPAAGQTLTIPLRPSNAVPEILGLLDPVFAHYVAQWEKVAAVRPREVQTRGFWLDANGLPSRILPPGHALRVTAIVRRHAPPVAWLDPGVAAADQLVPADAAGIQRYVWE